MYQFTIGTSNIKIALSISNFYTNMISFIYCIASWVVTSSALELMELVPSVPVPGVFIKWTVPFRSVLLVKLKWPVPFRSSSRTFQFQFQFLKAPSRDWKLNNYRLKLLKDIVYLAYIFQECNTYYMILLKNKANHTKGARIFFPFYLLDDGRPNIN